VPSSWYYARLAAEESTSEGEDKLRSVDLGSFQSGIVSDGNLTSHSDGLHSRYRTLWAVKAVFHPLSYQLDWKGRS
jgi:hypothetical protein